MMATAPIDLGSRRPLRVMHLLYSLGTGGMELGVLKLMRGLDPTRVQSAVCSFMSAEHSAAEWRTQERVFHLGHRKGNDPRLVTRLAGLFRRERPDIVHTHAWGTLCEGVLGAALARVPCVVHGEHGTMEVRPLQRRIQRLMWRRVNRVLAVSHELAARLSEAMRFPLDRITVIPNGVDVARFGRARREMTRASLGLSPDAFVVGTAGRCVAVKDQHMLLRAFAAARSRGLALHGVIAGDGPLRPELEHLAADLGLADCVRFLGARDDVPDLLAAMDVFALTSRSEGMSNTVLEAMAAGLPVLATRVGGNPELVDEGVTGELVPPQQPDALADALLVLGHDPGRRRRMGAAARARVEQKFSLSGMLRRYERLYDSVAPAVPAVFRTEPAVMPSGSVPAGHPRGGE